jgi:hypothetical protein
MNLMESNIDMLPYVHTWGANGIRIPM